MKNRSLSVKNCIDTIAVAALVIVACLMSGQLLAGSLNVQGNGTINGDLDVVSHRIMNVADPVSNQDVATKSYVDNQSGNAGKVSLNPDRVALLRWYDINLAKGSVAPGLGTHPGVVSFDGENIWVANVGNDRLSIWRAHDGKAVATYTFSSPCAGISGLAYDGEYMWVSCQGANQVRLVRARDFQSFAFLDISVQQPGAIAFDGTNMWVASRADGSVRVIEASSGTEKYNIAGSAATPVIEMAFDGTYMWATTGAASVAVLPASDPNGPGAGFFMLSQAGAWSLAFDGTNMWITNEAQDTVTVAGPGLVNLGEFAVGDQPKDLVFDGDLMWVANYEGRSVTLFRTRDLSKVGTIPLDYRPFDTVFDGANVWIADYDNDRVWKH
jgi:DNA-binding beta-propeller fold protein YncE